MEMGGGYEIVHIHGDSSARANASIVRHLSPRAEEIPFSLIPLHAAAAATATAAPR